MDTRFTKKYYKISEASEIIGVPQSTLRYWEKEFPMLKPRRSAHNQRFYSPNDLETLQIIHFLLYTKGYKVDAARDYMQHNKHNITKRLKVVALLEDVKSELEGLAKALLIRGENQ